MDKKILFTANLDSFFTKFLIPQLKWFKENGYTVHVAAKSGGIEIPYCDRIFDVDFARGFNIAQNARSYKQMLRIFKEEHYDIVSCHTPFGAAVTRLAARKFRKNGMRIVYMAHGFHFYKGAPKWKNALFYTAEKQLAKLTDEIITINLEDYHAAKDNFKTVVSYVPGIGLDSAKFDFEFSDEDKVNLRISLGLKQDDIVLLYSAELLPRKRQDWLIKTLSPLFKDSPNIHLLLAGNDSMKGSLQRLTEKLQVDKQVHFLGFRQDIPKIMRISDAAVSSSYQEGLPVCVMEAIYMGLPIVVTACRGNSDLIEENKNGFVIGTNDSEAFRQKVLYIINMSDEERENIKIYDASVIQKYLLKNVLQEIINIYLK